MQHQVSWSFACTFFSTTVIFFLIFIGRVFVPLCVVMQPEVSEGTEIMVARLSSTESINYKIQAYNEKIRQFKELLMQWLTK